MKIKLNCGCIYSQSKKRVTHHCRYHLSRKIVVDVKQSIRNSQIDKVRAENEKRKTKINDMKEKEAIKKIFEVDYFRRKK